MTTPLDLPTADWSPWLTERVTTRLEAAQATLARLKDGTRRTTTEVLELWNDADLALRNAGATTGLLAEVHPDDAVRSAAERAEQDVQRVVTERGLDRELYEVLAATVDDGLDHDAARLREHILRDFRRSGVNQPDDVRTRLREIADRLTALGQDFSRAIREDVRSVRLRPEQLEGLPDDYRAAHPAAADGLVTITTDYPDYVPFRTFARDADARRALTVEFLNRAWPANDATLGEMLRLRDEQAALLGYAGWPDFDTEVKMIGSGKAIAEFIERLAAAAEAPGRRDHDVLLARRRQDEPAAEALDSADSAYYSELVRREHFGVDAQEVRRYFDFQRVRQGLLDVTGRLFGVEYVPRPEAPTWHPDVAVFDVVQDGEVRGRIHLDLHPRDGKYKHAAQFDLVPGVLGRQLPEGVLVCNFPRGRMEHTDVVTLFHEFGHLLHHVLGGRQRFVRFSGVATEWDFVEAPSQMLEEWAWDADVLRTFALDDAGEPIPRDLVERMRAAKEFGRGLYIRTQLFYTVVSYRLHERPVATAPDDLLATVRRAQQEYDLFRHIDGTHFHASFGHLAGYTSAYYTYAWSLVIAKDLFAQFDPADLFAPEVARRYRDEILARGGSDDAAVLVQRFLGRPFTFDAFEAWMDAAPLPPSGGPA
ncbi:MAG: M3 family metallopeptidase [Jatrophihabitans sp.]|uniref:M3 family metallopeptidase n=1 Tax=Jatrophihabitans sp. TaxID=1932789 RepID=UPI003F7F2371